MPNSYERTIHFSDTDAAGVVYFARTLSICHEAYEEALGSAGLELHNFFSKAGVVVPIARAEADYKRPLACGDRIRVDVRPERLSGDSFAVNFVVTKLGRPEKQAAVARTVHVCIASDTRARTPLPPALAAWVDGATGPG
ncbi:1,4-dihydroxy-2-naphthoyl-CoA hydrolase [mine drainage metagenome]|uniref:1,4-dihydroxy-2-naphthoyl-CoA hydrolase n=1 Tax=mine drainage metagenome TaxID=410659 RepID=A0A1J5SFT7_9ZZZZ